jgi:5-oxoprolinase (ATP-hydrolysing)
MALSGARRFVRHPPRLGRCRPRVAPYGMAGGLPGARGRNHVERADGTVVELGPTDKIELRPGDVFVIETPGGGGFGPPEAGK